MQTNQMYLLLLVVVLVFSSCENKEVSTLTYPSVYHKAGVEASGRLRVFCSSGEIKRSAIVDRYSNYDTSYFNKYAVFLINDLKIADTVNFLDSSHARLHHQDKKTDYQLTIRDNLLLLTDTQATRQCCSNGEVYTRSLAYYLSRTKPEVRSEFVNTSANGYSFGFTGRQQYLLKESDGKLAAPLILYTAHAGKFDNGFVNNELQPDFYSNLAAGDTVSLREFMVYYEK